MIDLTSTELVALTAVVSFVGSWTAHKGQVNLLQRSFEKLKDEIDESIEKLLNKSEENRRLIDSGKADVQLLAQEVHFFEQQCAIRHGTPTGLRGIGDSSESVLSKLTREKGEK